MRTLSFLLEIAFIMGQHTNKLRVIGNLLSQDPGSPRHDYKGFVEKMLDSGKFKNLGLQPSLVTPSK